MIKVLVYAVHAEPIGYVGGGWARVIELLKISAGHDVKFVLIETQPTFKDIYKLDYESIEVPRFLNKTFMGRLIRSPVALAFGVSRVNKGDITFILSPVELPETIFPAFLTSKVMRLPWSSEIHLIPPYGSLWENKANSRHSSSLNDLILEHRRRGDSFFFGIFLALNEWLVFRVLRTGVMLAPNKSVVEDMKEIDPKIQMDFFYPGNGVAIERIGKIPDQKKHFDAVYVGVLGEKKGVFDAIKVWHLVVKKSPNATMAIVGKGDEKSIRAVKNLVTKLNLAHNVKFPFDLAAGAPTLEDVWLTMKQSKVLLHLSVSDTWPQVIGEAFACGIPVITYNLRPQLYAFGKCPALFVVPTKNIEMCSLRTLDVIHRDSTNFGESAKSFSKSFTWSAVLNAEGKAYRRVIDAYYN